MFCQCLQSLLFKPFINIVNLIWNRDYNGHCKCTLARINFLIVHWLPHCVFFLNLHSFCLFPLASGLSLPIYESAAKVENLWGKTYAYSPTALLPYSCPIFYSVFISAVLVLLAPHTPHTKFMFGCQVSTYETTLKGIVQPKYENCFKSL